jgi:hypothetical protein
MPCATKSQTPIKQASRAKATGLSLPESTFAQAKKKAFKLEMTFSAYVRELIKKDLAK